MKKINLKVILIILICVVLLCGITSVATYTYFAKDVSYEKPKYKYSNKNY